MVRQGSGKIQDERLAVVRCHVGSSIRPGGQSGRRLHKKDRDNIANDELDSFKRLAKAYALYDDALIMMALASKELMEICDD
jgi:hypothetical protein